ncbi:sodium:solute symporter family protein [Nocardiopsis chromatogenes]|uniref:sodium:solute symporter family protein n=1 Tax=Nocardiopsis chromatogenes TaxID=280239 RepID=UPI00034645A0|nr:sodium:solute symporter family protein [Nocardiopsis chromatogenes]
MSTTLAIALAGMAVIALCGMLGRRRPSGDLADWTVGGRNFGAATVWFLQAGEIFTAFTFLGLVGLVFTGGVAALYVVPYLGVGYILLFFVGPRIWRLGKERGYLTQGDFLADRYGSRALGTVSAVFALLFLFPYLQLQITGLGLVLELVTGDAASGAVSMAAGTVLVVVFVLWAGVRGVVATAYLKDAVTLLVIGALAVAVPIHYAGGVGSVFERLAAERPELLTLQAEGAGPVWFFSSALVSVLGFGLMGLPFLWNSVLSAGSARALRRNYAFLPLFTVVVAFPMVIGFTAVLVLSGDTEPNGSLLTLVREMLPEPLVGIVAVAALIASMVPAASMAIGVSTLVARNVVPARSPRVQFWTNHAAVVAACLAALLLALLRPDLLANLILLTYAGLVQITPAIALGLWRRRPVHPWVVLAGMAAGVAVTLALSAVYGAAIADVNAGLYGLAVNLAVVGSGALVQRALGRTEAVSDGPAGAAPEPGEEGEEVAPARGE